MRNLHCKRDQDWLSQAVEGLRCVGYAVVEGVCDAAFIETTRHAMYNVQHCVQQDGLQERLGRAGELGILRLMMKYDPHLVKFLEISQVLDVVNTFVSKTAILHLQNGFILPSLPTEETPKVFQNSFHQDFPRVLNNYIASVNIMFAIDAFTQTNGATLIVPGSHQKIPQPDLAYLEANAIPIECPEGSMIIFDSTLWHAAGRNTSGVDRLAINHQFTRSFIKQQIDYVRALGDDFILSQSDRTQQLLGWYTRVVTSLDEYYQPNHQRLYRSGQG